MTRTLPTVLSLALAASPAIVHAQASDPAAQRVSAFDDALLSAMKAGKAAGARGRFEQLLPAVERTFDLNVMTAYAVGPSWSGFSAADKADLVREFGRLTAASYAHNFDSYSGERFTLEPNVATRGADKIVTTRIVPRSGESTTILYRMRQVGGAWKVIDVIYGSVSQLTTRRADFQASVQKGGAKALKTHLQALTTKLVG